MNITHKTPSTVLADRVRTASQRDRERAFQIYVKKAPTIGLFPADALAKVTDNRLFDVAEEERMVSGDGPKLVRTGPMLGRGKCYDRGPVALKETRTMPNSVEGSALRPAHSTLTTV